MIRQFEQVDVQTGEVLEGTFVYVPNRQRVKGWFMAFQDPFEALVTSQNLNHTQLRVLLYMMSKLDFENYVHVPQVTIAKALKVAPPNVSAAVAALLDKGIVLAGPKVMRARTFRLSPDLGWKGRVKNLEAERKRRLKLVVNRATKR